jgi:hypothetical protein
MFIRPTKRWYGRRDGDQHAKGLYMLVACDRPGGELRAIVRSVQMDQCGHFMMGHFKVTGYAKITVSGGFGSDGLPKSKDDVGALWDRMIQIPQDIANAYWKDSSGHNEVGNKAPDFAEWANVNFKTLTKPMLGRALRVQGVVNV